eukprot:TRINITY_DN58224_c0_g1_i1.p1 TRINITY_DN58224_c0_g1~~TRINITY_DN58224_c0_g1_i1.p1  ORF type:complete len:478 (-),score=97.77 TRINITY_DN58224_c0_g1_i1:270-1703(-)
MKCVRVASLATLADDVAPAVLSHRGRRRKRPALLLRCAALVTAAVAVVVAMRSVHLGFLGARGAWHLGHRQHGGAQHFARSRVAAATTVRSSAPLATGQTLRSMSDARVYRIEPEQGASELPESSGVYSVFSVDGALQYIGLARQLAKSVEGHMRNFGATDAPHFVSEVRFLEMPGATKEDMRMLWQQWIKDHMNDGGEVPPGNLPKDSAGVELRWRSAAQASAAREREPLSLAAGARSGFSMSNAVEAVDNVVKSHPVVLFMKGTPAFPQCGFSMRAVGALRRSGVPFDSVNVLDDVANPNVREAVKSYSQWPTIPQLFVRGELVGGSDIISDLDEAAKLEPLLRGDDLAEESGAKPASPAESGVESNEAALDVQGLIDDPDRPTASLISKALSERLELRSLRVQDDSAQHEGDAGALEMGLTSESHFSLEVVATDFRGMSPVQRQQKVFDALADVMPRIHALSLVTKTPQEAAAA